MLRPVEGAAAGRNVGAAAKVGTAAAALDYGQRGVRLALYHNTDVDAERHTRDVPPYADTHYVRGGYLFGYIKRADSMVAPSFHIGAGGCRAVHAAQLYRTVGIAGTAPHVHVPAHTLQRMALLQDGQHMAHRSRNGSLRRTSFLHPAAQPEDLKALQKRLKKAMDIAAEYGFKQVYFYGFDEARGTRLMSQIPAWKAAQEIGAKIIVSGYEGHFEKVGKHLDICVYASDLNTAHPEDWHRLGHKIWKYNTPQAGCEDPNLYRRNYGLHLWSRGFDGGNTYCFLGHSTAWNDIASYLRTPNAPNHYRGMCMAYPTTDGVIETLSITGLHDAMKDIRYMTKLRQLLRQTPNQDVQRWFDSINFETADLTQVRDQTLDWILKLQSGSPD